MGKYVGETEKNMAAMFREVELESAILLLDEEDSFLVDRRGAQRSFEMSEVNEMLQRMERFHGIFICTTDLMDRIDQATLRRGLHPAGCRPGKAAYRLGSALSGRLFSRLAAKRNSGRALGSDRVSAAIGGRTPR